MLPYKDVMRYDRDSSTFHNNDYDGEEYIPEDVNDDDEEYIPEDVNDDDEDYVPDDDDDDEESLPEEDDDEEYVPEDGDYEENLPEKESNLSSDEEMKADQCNREENDIESAQSKSSGKRKLIRDRYKLLPPCSCKKRCIEKINDEQRKMIHQEFWSLQRYDERRN